MAATKSIPPPASLKKKEQASNSEEAPAWFKPFADDLAAVKSGLAVNADKEKGEKRAAVKSEIRAG